MSKNNINFGLQSKVRKYLEYTLKNESNQDEERGVLMKLSTSLRNELVMESSGKILKSIPFFKDNFSVSTIEKNGLFFKKSKIKSRRIIN